jgi:hypothetical protein
MSKKQFQFPRTFAAVEKDEGAQWAIGNALLVECGPPSQQGRSDGSRAELSDCAEELKARGREISVRHLAKLRQVAHAFPPKVRKDLSWTVHQAAVNPENLNTIIKTAPKGKAITVKVVEDLFEAWRPNASAKRRKAHDTAREERMKAQGEMREARAIASAAKDKGERKQATARAEEAAKKVKQASAKEEANKMPPRKRHVERVDDPNVIDMLARMLEVSGAYHTIKAAVRKIAKDVVPHLDKVDPEALDIEIDLMREAAEQWQDLITQFEAHQPEWKRKLARHLTVAESETAGVVPAAPTQVVSLEERKRKLAEKELEEPETLH